jgi:hypothetical protein
VLRFSIVSLCCKLVGKVVRLISCCVLLLWEISRGDSRRRDSALPKSHHGMAVVVEFVSVVPRRATRLCDLLNLGLVGGATLGLLVLELGHLVVVVIVITLVAHTAHAAHH